MAEAVHVVVVEDDHGPRQLAVFAQGRAGWRVTAVADGGACLDAIRASPDPIVLVDTALPDTEWRDLLEALARRHPDTPVVAVGREDLGAALEAMRGGAWDYVARRADDRHLEDLPRVVGRALERQRFVRERNRYRDEVEALANALKRTADGVTILDAGGRIAFVNEALARSWGGPESVIVGRLLEDFVQTPSEDDGLSGALAVVAAEGRWSGELRRRGTGGGEIWDVTLTPVRGPHRAERGAGAPALVGIFRDVSEKRALEQLRADFLSMVTHDIKSPLTVILGYTELLSDAEVPSPDVLAETLFRIHESGEQIHMLVSNFLELSRIEAGRLVLDRRPVDLAELVGDVIEQYGARARRKGVALTLTSGPLPAFNADPTHIERVIVNLLANAIKYTPAGGAIAVVTAIDGGEVVITVRDTGPGIPDDELPHLFEKYRRARQTRRIEGTGLGLFIAKTLVDAHGGAIRVESTPGMGSTFSVRLPY